MATQENSLEKGGVWGFIVHKQVTKKSGKSIIKK